MAVLGHRLTRSSSDPANAGPVLPACLTAMSKAFWQDALTRVKVPHEGIKAVGPSTF